jgi:hypothetical protein
MGWFHWSYTFCLVSILSCSCVLGYGVGGCVDVWMCCVLGVCFSKLLYFTIRNPLHSCNVDDFPKCGSLFPELIMTTDEFQESMQ